MKNFLLLLAIALMVGCWAGTTQAQQCYGGGYGGGYSSRSAVVVRSVPRGYGGGYGYGGYGGYRGVPVRSSSFYRGPSIGIGFGSPSPFGYGRSLYGNSFNRGGFGGYGGFGRGISIRF